MKFETINLKGAYKIVPVMFSDDRGYFYEWLNLATLKTHTGIDFHPVQFNCSKSLKGVLRGMHFQNAPYAQAKIIGVNHGQIQDVIIDLRVGSPSYGQWHSEILSTETKNQLYIPQGFAHGFLVLTESAEIFYAVDCHYSSIHEAGIAYNDSFFNINWMLSNSEIVLSEKDKNRKKYNSSSFRFHE